MKRKLCLILIFCFLLNILAGCALIEVEELPEEYKDKEQTAEQTSEQTAEIEFNGPKVAAKAPIGAKVAIVPSQASLSGCIIPAEAIEEIGQRYQWKVQMFDGEGTPDGQNSAIMNAVAWGAEIIITISLDARSVQQGIKVAGDAGIPIVSGSNGTDDPNPRLNLEKEGLLDFAYDVGPDYTALGEAMAEWMSENTNGSGKVVIYSCPGSWSVEYFEKGLLAGLKKTDLDVDPNLQSFTFEQMGDELNRKVIGYLTSNPDTEFVFLPFDPAAVSVSEALENAGLNDVKVSGVLGTEEMIALIRQGTVATSTAAYDNVYLGYATADQAIRILNGQDLSTPRGENVPFQIVDKTCLPDEQEAWAPNLDYKSAFYKLWD